MDGVQKSLDLFQRTCIKKFIEQPEEEKESEILSAESAELICEEEQCEEEEPLDIKGLMNELECMKRRIQKMQLKLKMMDMAKCPEEPCMDYEVLLKCSQNKEICDLQKNHYKLQCQIKELIRCMQLVKDQIEDLRIRMCEKSREILELQNYVASLLSWRDELMHEFGMCIERFEYLKSVKAEWTDVEGKIASLYKKFEDFKWTVVPRHCYLADRKYVINHFRKQTEISKQIIDTHSERFYNIEKRLNSAKIPEIQSITQEFGSNASIYSGVVTVPTATLPALDKKKTK